MWQVIEIYVLKFNVKVMRSENYINVKYQYLVLKSFIIFKTYG